MPTLNEDYREMLQLLLEEGIKFIIVGAYAMAAHGWPRATGDIDIWVQPEEDNAKKTLNVLRRFGCPLDSLSAEDLTTKGTIFQIGVPPRRIDIITAISGVEFHEAWQDCITVHIDGLDIPVLSREKIIINKQSTGREKDALDLKYLQESKKNEKHA